MLRQPDAYLRVQGERIDVVSLEAHLTREAKSDTFHATLALSGLPEALPLRWWTETVPIDVQAFITLDGKGADQPVFQGSASQINPNWTTGLLEVRGHDKTRSLIEAQMPDAHRNKTATDIIKAIAKRHGLKVEVEGGTQKAGRTYQIDHVHQTGQVSDWDVVNYLADAEGLSASVRGDTLHLKPDDEALPVLAVEYERPTRASFADGSFITLSGVWNLDQAKDTTVKVKSWDHKKKKVVEVEKKLAGKGGQGITYEYRPPGLKTDRASRIAEKRLARATGQERGVTVEVPGQPGMSARMRLALSGTDSGFDQTYDVHACEHRVNVDEGWRVLFTAKAASKGRNSSGGAAPGGKTGAGGRTGPGASKGLTGRNQDAGVKPGPVIA